MAAVTFRLRAQEAQDIPLDLSWDTVWSDTELSFDWVLTGTTPKVLQGNAELSTSVLIQLATWRHAEPGDKIDDDDPNGWWGDNIDIEQYEGNLGSRLWLLYRSVLNEDVRRKAILYAQEAMQTFLDQGVFVRVDITADMNQVRGILVLNIKGYSRDGKLKYAQRFGRLWQQVFQSEGIT